MLIEFCISKKTSFFEEREAVLIKMYKKKTTINDMEGKREVCVCKWTLLFTEVLLTKESHVR